MLLQDLVLFATLMATWHIITPALCHLEITSPVTATTLHSSHLLPTHVPFPPIPLFTTSALSSTTILSIPQVEKKITAYRNKNSIMRDTLSLAAGGGKFPISHILLKQKPVSLSLLSDKNTHNFNFNYNNNYKHASRLIASLKNFFKAEVGSSEVSRVPNTNSQQGRNISQRGGQNAEQELYWIFDANRLRLAKALPAAQQITSPQPRPPIGLVGSLKSNNNLKRNSTTQSALRGLFSYDQSPLASGGNVLYSDDANYVSVDDNKVKAVSSFGKYETCNKVNSRKYIFKRSADLQDNSSLPKNRNKVKKLGNLVESKSKIMNIVHNTRKSNGSYLIDKKANKQSSVSSPRYARYIKNNSNLSSRKSKSRKGKKSNNSSKARQASGRPGRSSRRRLGRGKRRDRRMKGLSLWIDSKQVKTFSGYVMEIFVIHNSRVLPYILDPNFEGQLPVIPAQVEVVNFTWRAGSKKYLYSFDHMYSQDEALLALPTLSIPHHGRVPRKPRVFSVELRCTGNASGIAAFGIGLSLHTQQGQPLTGTPLRLQLRKECIYMGPDPQCNEKCDNGGVCDEGQRCVCAEGYLGPYCSAALCYPRCMNGGTCTSPGRCSCPPGFNGRHCEGGICQHKCQNGGKCIQKDTCECRRGYYGNQCEFSKCVIPCINGGRCRDVNKCRCPHGFSGDHCEVILAPQPLAPSVTSTSRVRCLRRCRHGSCLHNAICRCQQGYTGRWCRRRSGRGSERQKKRVWV